MECGGTYQKKKKRKKEKKKKMECGGNLFEKVGLNSKMGS